MNRDFLKPKLVGPRFDDHGLPLEFLKDFAALEEMVVEVAKWKWKQDNPSRERVPRSFSQGLELKLAQVEDGSAIAAIVLGSSLLAQNPSPEDIRYFELGRDTIIQTVAAADGQQTDLPLPPKLLGFFDRFGRSLRDGERMEFSIGTGLALAALTSETRKRLVKASQVEEWTESLMLRGSVCAVDRNRMCFELKLYDGSVVKGPLNPQHLDAVLLALNGYREEMKVLVQGLVRKDRLDRLKSIEAVEHISALDPLDVATRLEDLSALEDGWLEGNGKALERGGLSWLMSAFDRWFASDVDLPHLYPTAEGGVRAEWSIGRWEASLDIDLSARSAVYHALHLDTQECRVWEGVLNAAAGWSDLCRELRGLERNAS